VDRHRDPRAEDAGEAGGLFGGHHDLPVERGPDRQPVDRQQRQVDLRVPPRHFVQLGDAQGVAAEEHALACCFDDEADLGHVVLGRRRGHPQPAQAGLLPRVDLGDVGESCLADPGGQAPLDHERHRTVGVGGEGGHVEVVVVAVADQHPGQLRHAARGKCQRLAAVVAAAFGEPRIGEQPLPGEIQQYARMSDAGDGERHGQSLLRHDGLGSVQALMSCLLDA
jgi:hypothetical protein